MCNDPVNESRQFRLVFVLGHGAKPDDDHVVVTGQGGP